MEPTNNGNGFEQFIGEYHLADTTLQVVQNGNPKTCLCGEQVIPVRVTSASSVYFPAGLNETVNLHTSDKHAGFSTRGYIVVLDKETKQATVRTVASFSVSPRIIVIDLTSYRRRSIFDLFDLFGF